MSAYARTPESHAAWKQLKHNVAFRPDEEQRAQRQRGIRELQHLLPQLQQSPTAEGLERFCRISEEVTSSAEQAFLRTMERDRQQDLCIADLQTGIEGYRRQFDEHLRLVDYVHEQHVLALQKQIEIEKKKRLFAENELRNAIAARRGK